MYYEKLDVYRCSIEYLQMAFNIMNHVEKSNHVIRDQLKRASLSIPLNIAEGSGKVGVQDKKRFYAIARGSAMECSAVMDVLGISKIIDSTNEIDEAKHLLLRIVKMLSKMCL